MVGTAEALLAWVRGPVAGVDGHDISTLQELEDCVHLSAIILAVDPTYEQSITFSREPSPKPLSLVEKTRRLATLQQVLKGAAPDVKVSDLNARNVMSGHSIREFVAAVLVVVLRSPSFGQAALDRIVRTCSTSCRSELLGAVQAVCPGVSSLTRLVRGSETGSRSGSGAVTPSRSGTGSAPGSASGPTSAPESQPSGPDVPATTTTTTTATTASSTTSEGTVNRSLDVRLSQTLAQFDTLIHDYTDHIAELTDHLRSLESDLTFVAASTKDLQHVARSPQLLPVTPHSAFEVREPSWLGWPTIAFLLFVALMYSMYWSSAAAAVVPS